MNCTIVTLGQPPDENLFEEEKPAIEFDRTDEASKS